MVPEISVPVTTVPKPFMVNTRSIGSRASAWESRAGTSEATWTSACFSSLSPDPLSELTGTIGAWAGSRKDRSEEHTSELQSRFDLVCRLLLEKKKKRRTSQAPQTIDC